MLTSLFHATERTGRSRKAPVGQPRVSKCDRDIIMERCVDQVGALILSNAALSDNPISASRSGIDTFTVPATFSSNRHHRCGLDFASKTLSQKESLPNWRLVFNYDLAWNTCFPRILELLSKGTKLQTRRHGAWTDGNL